VSGMVDKMTDEKARAGLSALFGYEGMPEDVKKRIEAANRRALILKLRKTSKAGLENMVLHLEERNVEKDAIVSCRDMELVQERGRCKSFQNDVARLSGSYESIKKLAITQAAMLEAVVAAVKKQQMANIVKYDRLIRSGTNDDLMFAMQCHAAIIELGILLLNVLKIKATPP